MSGLNPKHISLANSLCHESPYLQRLSHVNPQQLMSSYKNQTNRPKYHKKHRQDNNRNKYYTKWEMHKTSHPYPQPQMVQVPQQQQDQTQTIETLKQQIQQLQTSINMLQKQSVSQAQAQAQAQAQVQAQALALAQAQAQPQAQPIETSAYAAFKEPRMDSGMWYGRNTYDSSIQNKINSEKFELESYMEDNNAIGGVDLSSAFR